MRESEQNPVPELWDVLDRERRPIGRLHKRGANLGPGEYHLVVHVWIRGSDGRFLISQRVPEKPFGGLWECTAGSAVAGDDSLKTAVKEAREELGVKLDADRGRLIFCQRRQLEICPDFVDVWLFDKDWPIERVVCQAGETSQALWASAQDLRELSASGLLHPLIDYLEDFLALHS